MSSWRTKAHKTIARRGVAMVFFRRLGIITLMVPRAIALKRTGAKFNVGFHMQMTTSGYISAFQGLRALWGWWRGSEQDSAESEHEQRMKNAEQERELALLRAQTIREVAEVQAETERSLNQTRAQNRRERLQPVMAVYASVQAKKRARLSDTVEDDMH
jgi:hypothetical protein